MIDDVARKPEQYGYTDQNADPSLTVEGVPDEGASLAMVVDDPDAVEPAGRVWDHCVVWNVDPDTTEILEGWDVDAAGAVEGINDDGERGYGGPNRPDRELTGRFALHALDSSLGLPGAADADDVREAADGSILAGTRLTGTYAP